MSGMAWPSPSRYEGPVIFFGCYGWGMCQDAGA
jgi:hypothetical protein